MPNSTTELFFNGLVWKKNKNTGSLLEARKKDRQGTPHSDSPTEQTLCTFATQL